MTLGFARFFPPTGATALSFVGGNMLVMEIGQSKVSYSTARFIPSPSGVA
jgi:hypothetical protein